MYRSFLLCAMSILLWACSFIFSYAKANNTMEQAYLFSYFIGNGEDGLHLAYSYDGLTWTALNGGASYLKPTVGGQLMRDPSICQGPNGTFHLVWTTGWYDKCIGYASSKDLRNWSEQKIIPVMEHETKAKNAWAPELFYDEPSKTYYILWATTIPGKNKIYFESNNPNDLNHRIYYVTTKDFKTFSKTKLFFNPKFSVIDASIVKDKNDKDLILFIKNENPKPAEKNIRITRTKDIKKGFPISVSAPITGNYWAEGPAPLYVDSVLYVYFDKYMEKEYGAVRSFDNGKTWEEISEKVTFPLNARHGTAFAVKRSLVDDLLENREYNALIPDNIADPSVSKIGDTYYLYSTTDINHGLNRAGIPVVWKSKDFVNWSFEGSSFPFIDWSKAHTFKDNNGKERQGYFRFWAPSKAVERNGRYYLYATIVNPSGKACTYSLVSGHPDGPFHFAYGKGLHTSDEMWTESPATTPDIDGEPFIDDDGNLYIYWRLRKAARLSDDMIHIDGNPIEINTFRQGYSEGPLLFKRKGIYYYVYTLQGHQNYANAYMMSKVSPLSGFKKPEGDDIFLFSSLENQVWGPGHGNVFHDKDNDEYIFLYLEYGDGGTTRQVYANRMEFNDNGTIKKLVPTKRGIGYLAEPQEKRSNLSLNAHFYASSEQEPITSSVIIETDPNNPLPNKKSEKRFTRGHTYQATNVSDESNSTRWMADTNDSAPFITADLKQTYSSLDYISRSLRKGKHGYFKSRWTVSIGKNAVNNRYQELALRTS